MKSPFRPCAPILAALLSIGFASALGAAEHSKKAAPQGRVSIPTNVSYYQPDNASIEPVRKALPVKHKRRATRSAQYGTWGFDLAGADLQAKPGDDFFRYANGNWLDRVQIPADKPAYSLRLAMTDKTEQRLYKLIEAAAAKARHEPATTEGKVGAFYKSFMNEAAVEKAGAVPLKTKSPRSAVQERLGRDWRH